MTIKNRVKGLKSYLISLTRHHTEYGVMEHGKKALHAETRGMSLRELHEYCNEIEAMYDAFERSSRMADSKGNRKTRDRYGSLVKLINRTIPEFYRTLDDARYQRNA